MASGAAGLIYQVVWTQDLVLVFGDTTQAIVTTVTAFLCGLGIGSLLGAAIGARLRRAIVVYGLLEVAVACVALVMPQIFDAIATVFRNAYLSLPAGEVALIRFALAFAALTPVTAMMGMTLPILTRHLVHADSHVGERVARLYGLNTLGAVAGAVASGYLLIEILGLWGTTLVAVVLNLGAGLGALLISLLLPQAERIRPLAAGRRRRIYGRQWLLLGVTFASGLVSLALEMLWTRLLMQGTGSPVYVFVAILAVFLVGISGGSLAYERRKSRTPRMATLGVCLASAAVLTLIPLIVSDLNGPPLLPITVVLILPVAALLGYAFPLTVHLFVDSAARASRGVGLVYAANTAGCVVGTVTAGFVLIPALGTNTAIIVASVVDGAIGCGLAIAFGRGPGRRLAVAFVFFVTAILVTMNFAPAATLTYQQRNLALTTRPHSHFEDDVAQIDVVGGVPRARRLFINGTPITRLTINTKLLAYIPKALRPNASSMLNICFGMGSTFRSSIILGMRTDAVELDPTVPSLMPRFYSHANRYLHGNLGHVIISDGRNYVRLSNKHYDLITIDPPPPIWSAEAVVLMTQEFYQEARQRLSPGGVLASYITWSMPETRKLLLRAFAAAFPYVTVLQGGRVGVGHDRDAPLFSGLYLLGSDAPMSFRASTIMKVFGSQAARTDLAGADNFRTVPDRSWPSIIDQRVWLTDQQVGTYAGAGPTLTDDHPLTEYFMINDLYLRSRGYERVALELALTVTCLLALLVAGMTFDICWWRRRNDRAGRLPVRSWGVDGQSIPPEDNGAVP
jgi:predicted membrane-bound spermidine synthase